MRPVRSTLLLHRFAPLPLVYAYYKQTYSKIRAHWQICLGATDAESPLGALLLLDSSLLSLTLCQWMSAALFFCGHAADLLAAAVVHEH
jgi:hypothetical protein